MPVPLPPPPEETESKIAIETQCKYLICIEVKGRRIVYGMQTWNEFRAMRDEVSLPVEPYAG